MTTNRLTMATTTNESRGDCPSISLALSAWYLTGATAVGKSAVSLELAQRLDAEIISLDSMSIYRGMDLGTAKPTRAEQQVVPHHLIDLCEPHETFSVSRYRELALQTIREIQQRGKRALFVGGSALYLKAMLRGIFRGPPADWEFRLAVEEEANQVGPESLHRRLASIDPLAAHRLHVNDRRRIIRALEVYHLTGRPISHWQMEFDHAHAPQECHVFTLRRPRQELHERIAARVQRMFDLGFVNEVRRLLDSSRSLSRTASQAVGYREVLEYLCQGGDLKAVQEQILIRTRRFARHQETWFRGLSECQIIDIAQPQDDPGDIADRLLRE
ncbi:MAG TPA: tRNA (adenosine(37)-N6)-dimethylallyltransferase MiaA [Pirellulaceae bacterium]|nr:tRNA (adenosine(37)-N6)-dimethylallyltransferase MiaA [Pirellulaceae bacterium]